MLSVQSEAETRRPVFALNMAVIKNRRIMQPLGFTLILLLLFCHVSEANTFPTEEEVEKWADTLSNKLVNINYLFDIVKKIYTNMPSQSRGLNVTYENINVATLVKDMAKSLSEMLLMQMRALRKSVDAAEEAAAIYKWNSNLKKDDVSYSNAKLHNVTTMQVEYNNRFNKKVNFDFSSVHIPVEIYDGNIDILNGLNWTAAIDEQFKKNQEENPDMLWQYFGSQTGFLRTYPATIWPTVDGVVDLYDVRRQSW